MSERQQSTPKQWLKVEDICARVLDLPADQRASLLNQACAEDPQLRREVESLLANESDVASFLEASAGDVAADLLEPASTDFTGRRIGSYVIGEWIGSGGMGDVYRAHEEPLERDVALKVLPSVFADQDDRVARFMAEARTLAALNHPNIATIYGLQEAADVRALVLELVDGATLADLIHRGPLQIEDAIPIATQIAEGLEAAHECGIVHRDLKPSNVMVRPDGTVKLLDFGLATAVRASTAGDSGSDPVMATPAYASPEQVKGRTTDRRTDIWAFGVLLYEMLSGRPVFAGDSTSQIVSSVLRQPIDWSSLPASTPPAVHRLLARCLERDVRMRLRDIGEARIALEQLSSASEREPDQLPATAAAPRDAMRGVWPWARALAITAVAIAAAVLWRSSRGMSTAPAVARFTHTLPPGQSIALPSGGHILAVSPEGQQMVYVVAGGLQLRPMSSIDARMIPGSESQGAITAPVFSPGGDAIAFWSPVDRALKRLPVGGGEAVSVARVDEPYGMSWDGNTILIGEGAKGILRVRADGGTPETIVRVNEDEEAHGPRLLPDGDHVLFTLASGTNPDRWDHAKIVVQSLSSGQRTILTPAGTDARYAATGHLVYGRSDTTFGSATLFATRFDTARMTVGSAVPLIEGVRTASNRKTGALQYDLSPIGTLAYVPGSHVGPEFGLQQLVIADRAGKVEPLRVPPDSYRAVRVSPDGSRIAVEVDVGEDADIFVYDLNGTAPIRQLTSDGRNSAPVWSADGSHIAFQSDREGDRAIFTQAADGNRPARRLTRPGPNESHAPESWSPDGDTLLFSSATSSYTSLATLSASDGRVTAFGSARSVIPMNARFSPDGRWIAYSQADRGGAVTTHVEPFPATGANYQLVVTGANSAPHKPVWSSDGRELFYVPRLGGFEVVRVTTQRAFAFGPAVPVPRKFIPGAPSFRALFDIAPDGRFVGVVPVGDPAAIYAAPQIHIVLNWLEELKRLVPGSTGQGSPDLPLLRDR